MSSSSRRLIRFDPPPLMHSVGGSCRPWSPCKHCQASPVMNSCWKKQKHPQQQQQQQPQEQQRQQRWNNNQKCRESDPRHQQSNNSPRQLPGKSQRPDVEGRLIKQSDKGSPMPSGELVEGAGSNLDRFLECTTPKVQRQQVPKSFLRAPTHFTRPLDAGVVPFYTLGDLWDSFDEWSAYGAGVPINLPSGETVVQYYVPYLSALQIYVHSSNMSLEKRRLGDDSDVSDVELRESSSEASSDTEGDQKTMPIWRACTAPSEDSDDLSSSEEFCSQRGERGHLIFEFFERSAPYGRAPLADKIGELAAEFPKLRQLRSFELSSASWVSVAWYPIYRIPTGPTLRDLATCFLTFHSLSMPLQEDDDDLRSNVARGLNGKLGCCCCCCSTRNSTTEAEEAMREAWPVAACSARGDGVELRAFGLAAYKLRGGLWLTSCSSNTSSSSRSRSRSEDEIRRVISLAHSAEAWLKRYNVRHPDFDFFASHASRETL